MGKIEKILKKGPVEGQTTEVYPVTSTKAVYDENNKRLDNIITRLQESVYLNTPISISTDNTTESMAQNVKNIADYVEKAKAAGIASVNGMAVTCIIDNDYSGVGYLYAENTFCGIEIYGDETAYHIFVDNTGHCEEREIILKDVADTVTSSMLVQGARKPIIFTSYTTEVDEETYQKLLSDDVDVVFKANDDEYCALNYRLDADETVWEYYFTCFSVEGNSMDDIFIYGYKVSIAKAAPHTCTVVTLYETQDFYGLIEEAGYLNQSGLAPVLQEINLTGTDADRKDKLDEFETEWKALTGASDLRGARFVGLIDAGDYGYVTALLIFDNNMGVWDGVGNRDDLKQCRVQVNPTGTLTITPLFSHLEAITIYTDNTPEHMQANLANINAYEANLQALGVNTTEISPMIPVIFTGGDVYGSGFLMPAMDDAYRGYAHLADIEYGYLVVVSDNGSVNQSQILSAEYKSLNAKSLEAITIKTGNTPNDKAANVAAIKAYVDNLTALGVDVTKGYMIPVKLNNGYHGFIMGADVAGEHTGVIKRSIYIYGGGWIRIDTEGTYYFLEMLTSGSYALTTTSQAIVPAINEVNALAKGYSTIFTPIELTTDPAQNKTAIDARVAAFTAQGISLTNGCCIPVTYQGVYAGNISLINGDWYGLLVKNTNNPTDNINVKLSADGTIVVNSSTQ